MMEGRKYTAGFAGLLATLLILAAPTASAVSDGEREALVRLQSEIRALTAIVNDARRQADDGGRRRFNYAWLQQDLRRVRLGIDEYLTPGRSQPRSIKPIKGEYLR